MKNRIKTFRGFSLVELVMGMAIMTIVMMGTVSALSFYWSLYKKTGFEKVDFSQSAFALNAIVTNIQSSAWIEVPDNNTIILHSHSLPYLRKYEFRNGKIIFFKSDSRGSFPQAGTVLAGGDKTPGNIEAVKCFTGKGYYKKNTKSYSMAAVEFRNKSDAEKLFYAVASAKESWDAEYVSGAAQEGGAVSDGTRAFPYTDLKACVEKNNGVESELRRYDQKLRPTKREIIVLSGAHSLSGTVNLDSWCNLILCRPGEIKVKDGTRLQAGVCSNMILGSGFYRYGGNQFICVTSAGNNALMYFANGGSENINFDLKGFDFAFIHFIMRSLVGYPVNSVNIESNRIMYPMYILDVPRVRAYNNRFGVYLSPGLFIRSAYMTTCEIVNNDFDKTSSTGTDTLNMGIFYSSFGGSGNFIFKNNRFTDNYSQINRSILVPWSTPHHSESQKIGSMTVNTENGSGNIEFSNNSFRMTSVNSFCLNQKGLYRITMSRNDFFQTRVNIDYKEIVKYPEDFVPVIENVIRNNNIQYYNFSIDYTGNANLGVNSSAVFSNNYLYRMQLTLSNLGDKNIAYKVRNNIFYLSPVYLNYADWWRTAGTQPPQPYDAVFENNTADISIPSPYTFKSPDWIAGTSPYLNLNNACIRDCILCTRYNYLMEFPGRLMAPEYTNINASPVKPYGVDPQFVNYKQMNYRLKPASPCGSGPGQAGAYGGAGASGWDEGFGVDQKTLGAKQ